MRSNVNNWRLELGFDLFGITALEAPALKKSQSRLADYLAKNYHGTMGWMTRPQRSHPNNLWHEAKTALVFGANYKPDSNPLETINKKNQGNISVYAQSEDYHRVLGKKTKSLAQKIQSHYGGEVKAFIDTAPLMEKPLAELAGLGWQGKHSNLVSKELGSWFFLAIILTDLTLVKNDHNSPHKNNCGNCNACLEICPTNAFVAPYQLDSRRCISYLTIENKGHIPIEFRKAIGNRIYGCDDCLAVCPWNKFASKSKRMAELEPKGMLDNFKLIKLLNLNDIDFAEVFRHNPIKRIGRVRFLRNVLIAIGNSKNLDHLSHIEKFICDGEPLLRVASIWAYRQLASENAFSKLKQKYSNGEKDEAVLAEWNYIAA